MEKLPRKVKGRLLRFARKRIKDALRRKGENLSRYPSKEVTKAAIALIEEREWDIILKIMENDND